MRDKTKTPLKLKKQMPNFNHISTTTERIFFSKFIYFLESFVFNFA